ncbi:MAG: FTR1 family iron permease [Rhodospirillaceae bacterium]|nr:FTR1 family iron permease [Rhodospirillaceae bacterium]
MWQPALPRLAVRPSVLALALLLVWPAFARAQLDYADMVSRIETLLQEGVAAYEAGDVQAARLAVQRSYFEVFENLEGPIRINVSAADSYALEAEFGDIRQLILDGAPVDAVRARVASHIAAIRAVLPILEDGHRIVAEPPREEDPVAQPVAAEQPPTIDPHWEEVVAGIGRDIAAAADALEAGDADEAAALITRAHFDGYKNSLLETAVRRYVSQRRDIEFNAEFRRILALAADGQPARMVRASGAVLVDDLRAALPGLPLMGAAAERATTAADAAAPETDWSGVTTDIAAAMREAIDLAEAGERAAAAMLVQDTYFDVFEASGMEAQIGARDATFKAELEGYFSQLVAQIGQGASRAELEETAQAMAADMDRAADMLGAEGQSPLSLFVYALVIILREGVEAMLIVTAILTYLAKTGHSDKRATIVNSVVVALGASLATAVVLTLVLDASAASQEVLEGITMLAAAVVLFCMSYWLVSKAEAQKWTAFIKDKVDRSLTAGSLGALWFTSFLAVYREGAETVLFYRALTFGAGPVGLIGVGAGFLVGCLGLAVIYLLLRSGAMRLAIRPFFMVTGALLYAMAFIFLGNGVMELVEGRVIDPTLLGGFPQIPLIGIHPYVETLLPQVLLVLAALAAAAILARKTARQTASPQGGATHPR